MVTALIGDRPTAKKGGASAEGSVMETREVVKCALFIPTRPRRVVVRDLVSLPDHVEP